MKIRVLNFTAIAFLFFTFVRCEKDNFNNMEDVVPKVGDFYVAVNGDDNNPGTVDSPWRTIQKAVNTISPGKILVVKPGFYAEIISIRNSGLSEDERISIFSETPHTAKCYGFQIVADYVTIDGFEIEANTENWSGIKIYGSTYINIMNCFIHECPEGGINCVSEVNYTKLIGNKIDHNGMYGIHLRGSYGLIESNEITRSVQYHPKGYPRSSGADADGMRIFGDNHIIRSNIVMNIADPTDPGNIDPHPDGIQSWGAEGRSIISNTIIEGNIFSSNHSHSKGFLIDVPSDQVCQNLTIRNNIIEFVDIGIGFYNGEFQDIFVYHNIFNSSLSKDSWGVPIYFNEVENYNIYNNISVDCGNEHRRIVGGSGHVDYNLAWNSDGSEIELNPPKHENEIVGKNPAFVSYLGVHGKNDYHLLQSSAAINAGIQIEDVLYDFDGVERPVGAAYDIGPFEYK